MSKVNEVILCRLANSRLLTEHELAQALADQSGKATLEIQRAVGAMLEQLRRDGMVWCGKLTNKAGQVMYAAAITDLGRTAVKQLKAIAND